MGLRGYAAFRNTKLTFIGIKTKNTPCESDRGLKKGDKEPVAGVCFSGLPSQLVSCLECVCVKKLRLKEHFKFQKKILPTGQNVMNDRKK